MRNGGIWDCFATTIAQGIYTVNYIVRDTESLGRGGSGGYVRDTFEG
jgi:hypothetical protein